ncbi:acetylglutamate kinase [Hyalangium rubrum]|uniref:Acetylglutamate kinase n=1 Tax=Hyalangium rubrum TaxID=3103134 RepID=A0ABU5HAT8_9BACT|nr:acetylglutamate kinase [Hyalangium sp. s54d21]MDY7230586.1 acetylglutamate kinase [Hyalangium sp. s54d21]
MPLSPDPYAALRSAARYVRQFRRKTFVVLLDGPVLGDVKLRRAACEQLALLWTFSIQPVVVHGSGPEIDSPFDASSGRLRMDLLADLQAAGVPCVGLSGVDAGLLKARRRPVGEQGSDFARSTDYGPLGDIESVDARLLQHLRGGDYVPVVAPLAGDPSGSVFSASADTVAATVAVALAAEKLFFLLPTPGLLRDPSSPVSLIPQATLTELATLEQEGRLSGPLVSKAHAIRHALVGGVGSVHLVSGMQPNALLEEVFTNEGSGTMVVRESNRGAGAQG